MGAIERKTQARRPHAGNLGALERQKSSTFSVSRQCNVVAVELHAAQLGCCGAEVRGEIVRLWCGASRIEVVARGRAATAISPRGEYLFAIARNFSDPNCVKLDPNCGGKCEKLWPRSDCDRGRYGHHVGAWHRDRTTGLRAGGGWHSRRILSLRLMGLPRRARLGVDTLMASAAVLNTGKRHGPRFACPQRCEQKGKSLWFRVSAN